MRSSLSPTPDTGEANAIGAFVSALRSSAFQNSQIAWLRFFVWQFASSKSKNMKALRRFIGLAACCSLLSGCAHERSETTGSSVPKASDAAVVGQNVTFSVAANTNNGALTYQWVFVGTNGTSATNR